MNSLGWSLIYPLALLVLSLAVTGEALAKDENEATASDNIPVTVIVDAGQRKGELKPIWRYYGADEPNYATMPNGKKLLGELGQIGPQPAYFRAHNMLTTGDGKPALKWGSTNAYTEDEQGNPIYDWTIVDGIIEAGLQRGVKPYLQLGFMPKALSTKPDPYQHHWTPAAKYDEIYTGWAYPPKDYGKWGELVYQLTKHCVQKYGREEAQSWYWQVWNEPNIGYWRGTPEEFYKLYDYAVDGVLRALPTARVGGPEVAGGPGGNWLKNFLEHCARGTNGATGKTGSPLDFIAFHAKGAPRFVDNHVRMGIANQWRDIDGACAVIASFPEYKDKPIVIGESDPDGCAACQGPQLGYRNGTLYSSYTAASFARKYDIADKRGVNLEGALTWAFEFEDQPYFAGFRQLATNGIDMPVLNTFRMFGKMSGQRVGTQSSGDAGLEKLLQNGVREAPDVSALAALAGGKLSVMVWNYHDDDVAGPSASVNLLLRGLPVNGPMKLSHYRIDETHSNSYTVWKEMGSPQKPTAEQLARLEKAGQLEELTPPTNVTSANGVVSTQLELPRQAVSLLVLEWR
jgi:xylan 1,4-beta-xylosidase